MSLISLSRAFPIVPPKFPHAHASFLPFPTFSPPSFSIFAEMPYCKNYDDSGCIISFGSNGKPMVDYRLEDPSRPFRLIVEDETFYVNPHIVGNMSPVLRALCTGKFAEGEMGSATLPAEKADEIEILLQAICPTKFGLYPMEIDVFTFPVLAPLADRYLITGLRDACESFAVGSYMHETHWLTGPMLLKLFDAAIKGRLSIEAQGYLLWRILKRTVNDLFADDPLLEAPIGNLMLKAYIKASTTSLNHSPSYDFDSVPYDCCLVADCRKNGRPRRNRRQSVEEFSICSRCHKQMCRSCSNTLCEDAVLEYLDQELNKKSGEKKKTITTKRSRFFPSFM